MKTIIFDIDGTLTDMWPIEKAVLLDMLGKQFDTALEQLRLAGNRNNYRIFTTILGKRTSKKLYYKLYNQAFGRLLKNNLLNQPGKYPLVTWILENKNKYNFVYATGGQQQETLYVLERLGLIKYFDLAASIDKTTCRYSKASGIPFRIIKRQYPDCLLVTDSKIDCTGAAKYLIPCYLVIG